MTEEQGQFGILSWWRGETAAPAHLTDEEMDTLRDWWDEETTVGVESSFPIIARMIAARERAALNKGWGLGFKHTRQALAPGADALAAAWQRGWEAGCNDQQYGDENAEPWTPNPYRADRGSVGFGVSETTRNPAS